MAKAPPIKDVKPQPKTKKTPELAGKFGGKQAAPFAKGKKK